MKKHLEELNNSNISEFGLIPHKARDCDECRNSNPDLWIMAFDGISATGWISLGSTHHCSGEEINDSAGFDGNP